MSTFGPAYQASIDGVRLLKQIDAIRELMIDGVFRTLAEIRDITGFPEASISSDLRHLRKARFGGYEVLRRRRLPWDGVFEYQVSAGGNSDPKPPAASVLQRRDAAPASFFKNQGELFKGVHSNKFRIENGI